MRFKEAGTKIVYDMQSTRLLFEKQAEHEVSIRKQAVANVLAKTFTIT